MNINCFICQYKRTTAASFSTVILQMNSEGKLDAVIIAGNQIFLNPDLTVSRRKNWLVKVSHFLFICRASTNTNYKMYKYL